MAESTAHPGTASTHAHRLLRWRAVPVLWLLATAAIAILLVLRLNGAIFYTLDDPYIHLALSERIARGLYGLNPGEAAAPSSSILWPFLLAPFAESGWHHLTPLALALAASAAALALIHAIVDRSFGGAKPALAAFLAILIAWCAGALPLIFTGMEHSLHLPLALAMLLGLAILIEERELRAWLPAAIVLAPLVRYEAAALSLIALIVIWRAGHRRAALLTACVLALALAAFSLFLLSQGLAPLPGSVLAKLDEGVEGSGLLAGAVRTANFKLAQAHGRDLLLPACLVAIAAALLGRRRWVAAAVGAAFLMHLVFGLLTERYVVYLRALLLLAAAYMLAPQLVEIARRKGTALAAGLVLLASLPLALEQGRALVRLPASARDIRLLQAEAHRFILEEWKRPVAVNDLGQSAYRNPHYVLDLWGLGSQKARHARRAGGRGWARPLLDERGIALALVFDSWLGTAIPEDWVRLGALKIDPAIVAHMREELALHARPDEARGLARRLDRFARTLPAGVRFLPDPAGAADPQSCQPLADP